MGFGDVGMRRKDKRVSSREWMEGVLREGQVACLG
jgi:hypothetical protein